MSFVEVWQQQWKNQQKLYYISDWRVKFLPVFCFGFYLWGPLWLALPSAMSRAYSLGMLSSQNRESSVSSPFLPTTSQSLPYHTCGLLSHPLWPSPVTHNPCIPSEWFVLLFVFLPPSPIGLSHPPFYPCWSLPQCIVCRSCLLCAKGPHSLCIHLSCPWFLPPPMFPRLCPSSSHQPSFSGRKCCLDPSQGFYCSWRRFSGSLQTITKWWLNGTPKFRGRCQGQITEELESPSQFFSMQRQTAGHWWKQDIGSDSLIQQGNFYVYWDGTLFWAFRHENADIAFEVNDKVNIMKNLSTVK